MKPAFSRNSQDLSEECPVLRRAASLGMEVKRSLHRLEKTLDLCRSCTRNDECETSELVTEWVERAAREVLEELGG